MFFWGVFLPLLCVAAHAFLHVKGKTLIVKGPFWKKKKEIELEPNEAKKKYYTRYLIFSFPDHECG